MTAVGITESAKGDNKKFEVWCNSRDEVFIAQVSSLGLAAPTGGGETPPLLMTRGLIFSSRLRRRRLKRRG